jgi:hypothetical protein
MATLKEVKAMIRALLERPQPMTLMLWGPPGVGKTSAVAQVAQESSVGMKAVISHLYQPVDVLGLPYIVDGKCEYAPPTIFPDAGRDASRGIFFLDELPNCVPAMQSAWGIIILERSTKQYQFPPNWLVVCAGNREGDRAGATRLVSALENRMIHVEVTPNADEFLSYGVSQQFHPMVLSFLEERRDLLMKFDPRSAEKAFPSPRSWERASEALSLQLPEEISNEMIRGAVGVGAATEFLAFLKVKRDLPTLQEVLSGSVKLSRFSNRPDIVRASIYSVLSFVAESKSAEHYEAAIQVALGAPDEWAVVLLKRLQQLDAAKLLQTKSWREIVPKYGKYLL